MNHHKQVIQPGRASLVDGSVSCMAPSFAAAFATRNHRAFNRVPSRPWNHPPDAPHTRLAPSAELSAWLVGFCPV
jgi:hypothetical protein